MLLYWAHFLLLWEKWTIIRLLRGHSWVHFAHRLYCTVTLNSELRYLKNLKLFSIRVKELFEPIVLRKKGEGFLLFL